ncbi:hypothetical protein D9O29_23000 [Pantoea vagans]|uniref:Uncharacterized protein n=1 Tax=Pantoea vagans TaxID=470934 RepID=A0ABY3L9Q2_9GAMM|nr:hypothetical protein D9O29_23000 [Pantoea vagans]
MHYIFIKTLYNSIIFLILFLIKKMQEFSWKYSYILLSKRSDIGIKQINVVNKIYINRSFLFKKILLNIERHFNEGINYYRKIGNCIMVHQPGLSERRKQMT